MKDRIYELCEKAKLPKPGAYTSFVWLRACGDFKRSAADDLSVSVRTLDRWENKVTDNLTAYERSELIGLSVKHEFEKRLGESDE